MTEIYIMNKLKLTAKGVDVSKLKWMMRVLAF